MLSCCYIILTLILTKCYNFVISFIIISENVSSFLVSYYVNLWMWMDPVLMKFMKNYKQVRSTSSGKIIFVLFYISLQYLIFSDLYIGWVCILAALARSLNHTVCIFLIFCITSHSLNLQCHYKNIYNYFLIYPIHFRFFILFTIIYNTDEAPALLNRFSPINNISPKQNFL